MLKEVTSDTLTEVGGADGTEWGIVMTQFGSTAYKGIAMYGPACSNMMLQHSLSILVC